MLFLFIYIYTAKLQELLLNLITATVLCCVIYCFMPEQAFLPILQKLWTNYKKILKLVKKFFSGRNFASSVELSNSYMFGMFLRSVSPKAVSHG